MKLYLQVLTFSITLQTWLFRHRGKRFFFFFFFFGGGGGEGAAVVFWSAAHLNENTVKCRQLLNGFRHESRSTAEKLKLRANTVNLALKLGSPFGEFSFHNIYFSRTKLKLHSM